MTDRTQARDFLLRVRHQEDRVRQLERARVRALTEATSATASPSASGVRGGGPVRGGESYALLSAQVDEELRALNETRAETLAVIGRVEDNTLAALLMARYVNSLPWSDVAAAVHYSFHYCRYQLHDRALDAVAAALDVLAK